jgi:hypothetical protein
VRVHRKRIVTLAVTLTLLMAASTLHVGAAAPAEKNSSGWEFDIVPYLWGAGLEGDLKIGRLPTGGVEASFSDIWNHLQLAGMAAFEARKNRWGVLVDAIYIDLSDTMPTPRSIYGSADITMTQQLYAGLVTYRIYDGEATSFDMGWGGRYFRLDSDLELISGIAVGRTASGTMSWWNWLAAARFIGHPSKRWSLTAYADLGASGEGSTWEGIASADFACTKTVSIAFGYRYMNVDYEKNEFLYDVAMQGPFVGVGFHF